MTQRNTDRTATIYVLADSRVTHPVMRIRYVGRTVRSLAIRLRDHWTTANADEQTHRARWMRAVRNGGGHVVIEEIARVPFMFIDAAEIDFIARLRREGADLTNTTAGGRGLLDPSEDTRAKMSSRARGHTRWVGKKHTAEARVRMRARHLGKQPTAEHRHKISVALRGARCHMAKLTWEQVADIRSRYALGDVSKSALARTFDVSRAAIRAIVQRKTWVS